MQKLEHGCFYSLLKTPNSLCSWKIYRYTSTPHTWPHQLPNKQDHKIKDEWIVHPSFDHYQGPMQHGLDLVQEAGTIQEQRVPMLMKGFTMIQTIHSIFDRDEITSQDIGQLVRWGERKAWPTCQDLPPLFPLRSAPLCSVCPVLTPKSGVRPSFRSAHRSLPSPGLKDDSTTESWIIVCGQNWESQEGNLPQRSI